VGATVYILGTNLSAPASVTFNGVAAAVTSISPLPDQNHGTGRRFHR
jgi:hypothetical protein